MKEYEKNRKGCIIMGLFDMFKKKEPTEDTNENSVNTAESTNSNKAIPNYSLLYHLALCFYMNSQYNFSLTILDSLLDKRDENPNL